MAVIDLGDLRSEPPPAPPRPPRLPRGLPHLLLGVVMLLALTGAAPRARPLPATTISASIGAAALLSADRVYVVIPPRRADEAERMVSAYRLPDARPLWRISLTLRNPTWGRMLPVAVIDDTVVVSSYVDSGARPIGEVFALDAATGQLRWRRPGRLIGGAGDPLVMLLEDHRRSVRVMGVAVTTGVERWSLPVPVDAQMWPGHGDQSRLLVVAHSSGLVEVRDADTGELLRESRFAGDRSPAVRAAGDLLLRYDAHAITAYQLPNLEQRWSVPRDRGAPGIAYPCGDLLCLIPGSRGVRVVDPRDGRIRWRLDWADYVEPIGRYLAALGVSTLGAPQRLVVLDPESGRQIGDLGPWTVIDPARADGRVTAIRRDPETSRVQVALLDPATARVHTVAMLDRVSGECQATGDVLLCRRVADFSFGIWTLPSS
ncbi:MAG TPA: PQQ-binding-like beta-propeller repeat protein [Micromonospora sp.]